MNDYAQRIRRVLDHIQDHLDEELALEDLAALACFSMSHFHRVFKGMLGEGVKEHVRRLRLERAAQRLLYTGRSVTELCFEAGYETPDTFSRAFKAMFGLPPSEFRAAPGRPWPPSPSGIHYQEGANAPGGPFSEEDGQARRRICAMDVSIRKEGPLRVLCVRHVGSYMECGKAWGVLCGWAGPKGLLHPGMAVLGMCYDDPAVTPPEKIRYDACLVVGPDVELDEAARAQGLCLRDLPGGEFAVTLHKGPYEGLYGCYEALFGQWLPQSGRTAVEEASREFYLNDPETTPPEELLTEIHIRLA